MLTTAIPDNGLQLHLTSTQYDRLSQQQLSFLLKMAIGNCAVR